MKKLLKQYVLWTYGIFYCFILVIGITMLVLKQQSLAEFLKVVSAWTSTFVFLAMFSKIYPEDNIFEFIKRQFREKIKVTTIVSIILLQLSIFLGSIVLISNSNHIPIKSLIETSWISWLFIFGDSIIRGPLGEEIGWRGFVLNELQKKFNPLKSAIIVGVAWGVWHTPLWLLSGYSGKQLILYIISFLINIIAASVIMTVFYIKNHNLLIPILIHQLYNYFFALHKGDVLHILVITSLLYFIVAVILVFIDRRKMIYANM